ncbi:MAG: transglycosylase SLT domain-containing protein [Lachnospiraceae bacterium]|nr:transglycosylase SLT domain-containing protein [Lachnospiraceae bacterium]
MQYNKREKRLLFAAALLVICSTTQIQLNAQGADSGISKEYIAYCEEIGMQYGICPELLEAIIESESSGNAKAQNGECKGLMQIHTHYHKERMDKLGVTDIYDAKGNILVAADYLAELFMEHGDMGTVLMVYNGSSDAMERSEKADYTEYAKKIMKRSAELERIHGK